MPIGQPPIAFGFGDFFLCRRPGPSSYVEDSIRPHTSRELEGRCHTKRLARVRCWSALPAQLALENTWSFLLSRNCLLRDLSSFLHQSSNHESRSRVHVWSYLTPREVEVKDASTAAVLFDSSESIINAIGCDPMGVCILRELETSAYLCL